MKWLAQIADMLWPLTCLGCRRAGTRLCTACQTPVLGDAHSTVIGTLRVCSAGSIHNPILHRAVWELKYKNAQHLSEALGTVLAAAVDQLGLTFARPLVVPVPLHPRRLRTRGYNQAQLLAHQLSRRTAWPLQDDLLIRQRATKSQVETRSRPDRLKNMRNAFVASPAESLADHQIILVDDVCTTGATMLACTAALRAAGATSVTALVLARG